MNMVHVAQAITWACLEPCHVYPFLHVGHADLPNVRYQQLDPPNEYIMDEFSSMSVNEFLKIVDELSYAKSSGVDDLNSKLIIDAMRGVQDVFVKICNKSLQSGIFPTSCKTARITVIPKKGDIRCLDNLRPISILSILGKIIEKHIKIRDSVMF